MWVTRDFLADRCPETLDLFIWDRSPLPLTAHESKHSWRPQNLQPLFARLHDSNEGIAAKHRDFHLPATVTPFADLMEKRKKRAHTLFFKLCRYLLFVPRHRMNRVPL